MKQASPGLVQTRDRGVRMRILSFALVMIGFVFLAQPCAPLPASWGEQGYPGASWSRARTAEELGWSTEKLKLARAYSASINSAAVMIVVDGQVVDEWGETARRYNVHSIRKSFLNALVGIAVQERQINLESTLEALGIDDNPPSLTRAEKQARVRHLLQARSGVYHPALYESSYMRANRPTRGSHPPGAFWYYNNWDFNALGTIYDKATHSTIPREFKRRIAYPLQMEDFRLEDVEYVRGDESAHPAYQFRMSARDMARFGLLFLRRGAWQGRQLIPVEWVAESTKAYTEVEGGDGGFGYMWWVAVRGVMVPGVQLKDGAFAARGAGGHNIVVIPDLRLVVVHRVNTDVAGASISADQFGRLLKLILDAQPAKRGDN